MHFLSVCLSFQGWGWDERSTSGDPGKALGTSFPGCFALSDVGVSLWPSASCLEVPALDHRDREAVPRLCQGPEGLLWGFALLQFLNDLSPA